MASPTFRSSRSRSTSLGSLTQTSSSSSRSNSSCSRTSKTQRSRRTNRNSRSRLNSLGSPSQVPKSCSRRTRPSYRSWKSCFGSSSRNSLTQGSKRCSSSRSGSDGPDSQSQDTRQSSWSDLRSVLDQTHFKKTRSASSSSESRLRRISASESQEFPTRMESSYSNPYLPQKMSHSVTRPFRANKQIDSDSEAHSKSLKSKIKKISKIIDSESDEDVFARSSSAKNRIFHFKTQKKKMKDEEFDFVDTDSEAESVPSGKKSQFKKKLRKKSKQFDFMDTEYETDSNPGNEGPPMNILDSESGHERDFDSNGESIEAINYRGKNLKRRKGSEMAEKDVEMQKIHSETERLVRESEICLPYHVPKQRSLQEFMNRKKVMTAIIPQNLTTAEKMRMFPEWISKVVKEQEKEAKEFYKSSDSEEEPANKPEIQDMFMEFDRMDSLGPNALRTWDLLGIGDTQILSHDIQQAQSKKEILQQNPLFKVPRKLFTEDDLIREDTNESQQTSQKVPNEDENLSYGMPEPTKKRAETRLSLNSANLPRKLFSNDQSKVEVDLEEPMNDSKEIAWNLSGLKQKFEHHMAETPATEEALDFTRQHTKPWDFESNTRENTMLRLQSMEDCMEHQVLKNFETPKTDKIIHWGIPNYCQPPSLNLDEESNAEMEPLRENVMPLREQILEEAKKFKPVIKAAPGSMIDFSYSKDEIRSGMKKLFERFSKHVAPPKKKHKIAEVTVLHTKASEGVEVQIVEEVLSFKVSPKKQLVDDSKPGEKLIRLKQALKNRIAKARCTEWKQKENLKVYEDEEITDSKFYENLPDDELLNEESTEGESEPEEDYIPMADGRRGRNDFLDEEAESEENEGIEENDEKESVTGEPIFDNETNSEEDENIPRVLKRIMKPFEEEDSDLEENIKSLDEKIVENEMDPEDFRNKICKTPCPKPSNGHLFSLISPVTQLTALNNYSNSMINMTSPAKLNLDKITEKQLFCNYPSDQGLMHDDSLMMELRSGNFEQQVLNKTQDDEVTVSQLLDLCSGKFTTQARASQEENSQEIPMNLEDNSQPIPAETVILNSANPTLEIDSTPEPPSMLPTWTKLVITSSSEDETKEEKPQPKKIVLKKKKPKVLRLSDDEDGMNSEKDSKGSSFCNSEEANEQFVDYDSEENEVVVIPKKDIQKVARANFVEEEAELSDEEWEGSDDEDEQDLDEYEKEEGDKDKIDQKQLQDQLGRIHMKQILDQDQRDVRMLQDMLFEDGDLHSGQEREKRFKWKNYDLMNVNDLTSALADDAMDGIDDDVDPVAEHKIRKIRYEQHKFLATKEQNFCDIIGNDFGNSMVFDSQMRVMNIRSSITTRSSVDRIDDQQQAITPKFARNNEQNTKITANILKASTSLNNKTFSVSSMRGSFLARSDTALIRIAQNLLNEPAKTNVDNTRRKMFVFQHVSPCVVSAENAVVGDNSESYQKKGCKRKITASNTPKTSKKVKIDERPSGKKLF